MYSTYITFSLMPKKYRMRIARYSSVHYIFVYYTLLQIRGLQMGSSICMLLRLLSFRTQKEKQKNKTLFHTQLFHMQTNPIMRKPHYAPFPPVTTKKNGVGKKRTRILFRINLRDSFPPTGFSHLGSPLTNSTYVHCRK